MGTIPQKGKTMYWFWICPECGKAYWGQINSFEFHAVVGSHWNKAHSGIKPPLFLMTQIRRDQYHLFQRNRHNREFWEGFREDMANAGIPQPN